MATPVVELQHIDISQQRLLHEEIHLRTSPGEHLQQPSPTPVIAVRARKPVATQLNHADVRITEIATTTSTDELSNASREETNSSLSIDVQQQFLPDNEAAYMGELTPVLPPRDAPPLDWRPFSLKARFLWFNIVFNLLVTAAIYCIKFVIGDDLQVTLTNANAMLISSYAPTLLATINWQVFRVVFFELFRMIPYFRMADQNGKITTGATQLQSVGGCWFPYPFARYHDAKFVKWPGAIILFVFSFLVAFKAILLGMQQTADGWILTVYSRPAYYLMAAYTLMSLFYIAVYFCTRNLSTGLKWEPGSPMNHIALVINTDAMLQFSALSVSGNRRYNDANAKFGTVLSSHVKWRVGYWMRGPTLVYGVGMINHETLECEEDSVCTCRASSPQKCNGLARTWPISGHPLLMGVSTFSLVVAVVAVVVPAISGAWNNGMVLTVNQGSDPSSSNLFERLYHNLSVLSFLFTLLPVWLAGIYTGSVVSGISMRLRDTQCWIDLASGPKTMDKSLGIDYLTPPAVLIPVIAILREHYRLAFISTVDAISPGFPIFVAGLFTFEQPTETTLLVLYSKPAFVFVCIYLLLYAILVVLGWPWKSEGLLRPMMSFADRVRPYANSMILTDKALRDAADEKTQERAHAKALLADNLYQLGILTGTCGHQHLGAEIIGKDGGELFHNIGSAELLIRLQDKHRGGLMHWFRGPVYVDQKDGHAPPPPHQQEEP